MAAANNLQQNVENQVSTLLAVADDRAVTAGEVPATREPKPTAAMIQDAMPANHPHQLTQDDVLFTTWLKRRELAGDDVGSGLAAVRQECFSVSKACPRASPLAKRHGWGPRFDDKGQVALRSMESPACQAAVAGRMGGSTRYRAMRSRRA